MSNIVTHAELREIASDLLAMAAVEPAEDIREALNRLATRYAALGDGKRAATRETSALH
jgi:hypothetical protein